MIRSPKLQVQKWFLAGGRNVVWVCGCGCGWVGALWFCSTFPVSLSASLTVRPYFQRPARRGGHSSARHAGRLQDRIAYSTSMQRRAQHTKSEPLRLRPGLKATHRQKKAGLPVHSQQTAETGLPMWSCLLLPCLTNVLSLWPKCRGPSTQWQTSQQTQASLSMNRLCRRRRQRLHE